MKAKPLTVREIQRERRKSYRNQMPKKCCGTCRYMIYHLYCSLLYERSEVDCFEVSRTGLCSFWQPEEK